MLGQVNFSDMAILCNRPNNCCQQNLKWFDDLMVVFMKEQQYEAATGSKIFRRGDGDSPPGTSMIQHQHPMIQHQHVCECL